MDDRASVRTQTTSFLIRARAGDERARAELDAALYDDLHALAVRHLSREHRLAHRTTASSIVSQAYLRLVDIERIQWADRVHFLAVASHVMERILTDVARAIGTQKRGGDWKGHSLKDVPEPALREAEEWLAVHVALDKFRAQYPREAEAVVLRYFGEMTTQEIADHLGVSPRTVRSDLEFAEPWLGMRIAEDQR